MSNERGDSRSLPPCLPPPATTCHLPPAPHHLPAPATCHHTPPHTTTCHHTPPATCHHLPLPATACHYLPLATTCHQLRPPASNCQQLPPATTCLHLPPPATTCHLPRPPATTCRHLPPATTGHHTPPPAGRDDCAAFWRSRLPATQLQRRHGHRRGGAAESETTRSSTHCARMATVPSPLSWPCHNPSTLSNPFGIWWRTGWRRRVLPSATFSMRERWEGRSVLPSSQRR